MPAELMYRQKPIMPTERMISSWAVMDWKDAIAIFRAYGSKGAGPRGSWTKEYVGSETSEQRLQGKDGRQS
jgi:hypothetical protein